MTNPTADPSPQQAVAVLLKQVRKALEATMEVVDGVPQWHNAGYACNLGNKALAAIDAALATQAVSEPPAGVAVALRSLRDEAMEIFDGPETPQGERDVIEWFAASINVIIDRAWKQFEADIRSAGVDAVATPTMKAAELTEAMQRAEDEFYDVKRFYEPAAEPAASEFDPSLGKASEVKGEPQTSLTAPAAAPDMVMVPREPTQMMLTLGSVALRRKAHGDFIAIGDEIRGVYSAMITAAAAPSAAHEVKSEPEAMSKEQWQAQATATLERLDAKAQERRDRLNLPEAMEVGEDTKRPGWMPIETAPKDELILLHGAKRLVDTVGMFHSRDGWVSDSTAEFLTMYPPTHWMPLPAAPASQEKTK